MPNIKIIGLGNIFGGDDAVGNVVARRLLPYESLSVSIVEGGLGGLNLLHDMEETDTLILIDAVQSRAEPGTILRFTVPQDLTAIGKLTWNRSTPSTHAFGLGEALTLANTLRLLPQRVIIYGIESGRIKQGEPLSPLVSRSIPFVVRRIVNEDLRQPVCANPRSYVGGLE